MPASSAFPGSDPVRFAYWVPNVSGGLVTSTVEQRTDWGYEYNRELAVLAENNGFDYALSQVRYMARRAPGPHPPWREVADGVPRRCPKQHSYPTLVE
ncbi:hypothetical protein AB0C13_35245, partial [Streptomyces sp. NPDC049099]